MSLVFYISKGYNVFSLLRFQRLQCLRSFTFPKTSMSSVFYAFKNYNVFSLLCFQRLQCLMSFMLAKTTMSLVFYAFKDFNVFSFLCFQRLQYPLLYVSQDYNVLCLMLSRLQCPLLLCSTGLICPPFYVL